MADLRQKQPRLVDSGFLEFLRSKPCCVCRASPRSQAAHIRIAALDYGKQHTGMQEKPSDFWAVPLCGPWPGYKSGCHALQHQIGEEQFWRRVGEHPCEIAIRLYREYGGLGGKPYRRPRKHKAKATGYWEHGGRQVPKRKIQSRGFQK